MAENPEETPENIVEEVEHRGGAAEAGAAEETPLRPPHGHPQGAQRRRAQGEGQAGGAVRARSRTGSRSARRTARTTRKQRRAYRAKQKAKRAEARAAAPAVEEQHAPEHGPGKPKVRQGVVMSDKGEKTIIVRVDIARRHKRYHKILRSSMTLHVHDESNDAHAGDTVRVQECRPMSRTKRWRLLEVLERAR